MKTTIQELISELEEIKKTKCNTIQEVMFFDGVLAIIEAKYLEKEKNQLINFARLQLMCVDVIDLTGNFSVSMEPETLYNKNYNTNEKTIQ